MKVTPIEAPPRGDVRRIGFMKGEIKVPEDFDRMDEEVIVTLFQGED